MKEYEDALAASEELKGNDPHAVPSGRLEEWKTQKEKTGQAAVKAKEVRREMRKVLKEDEQQDEEEAAKAAAEAAEVEKKTAEEAKRAEKQAEEARRRKLEFDQKVAQKRQGSAIGIAKPGLAEATA